MPNNHIEILNGIYDEAKKLLGSKGNITPIEGLSQEDKNYLDKVLDYSEKRKGVLTVLITSLTHKILRPEQDTRKHQTNIAGGGGYSGRTIDTKYITPFLKEKRLPAMAESGWLSRTLEQNYAYSLEYNGKITPPDLKTAFLNILDRVEAHNASPRSYLLYIFQVLIHQRENRISQIVRREEISNFSIDELIDLLVQHFDKSTDVGTARLPVIAVFSIYELMIKQIKRFEGTDLLPLASHTSADFRSGNIGDIEVVRHDDKSPFEGVEIKYGKPITNILVADCYEKFKKYPLDRYYILSTEMIPEEEQVEIISTISIIAKEHGCEVIVNGLIRTLQYYLRLLENTDDFIDTYTKNLLSDGVIKEDHKKIWKEIIESK
jgi:DNA (cytosine-5)-methyltransferase 1